MELNVRNNAGLVRIQFRDNVDNHCIAQVYKSSISGEDKLRIGVIESFNGVESTPMCLSRDEAKVLLSILYYFSEYGTLPFGLPDDMKLSLEHEVLENG